MFNRGDILDVKAIAGDFEVGQFRIVDHSVEFGVEFDGPAHAGFRFVVDGFLPEVLPLRVQRHRTRHGDA